MPITEQKPFQKRQVAYKVRILDILNSIFIKDDISAGHIRLNENNVSRVNLIVNVVYKPEEPSSFNSIMVDDGTGRISLRSFEKNPAFAKVDVGDFALVIGKVREYNNEKYILPEILKKLESHDWMNVRKIELASYDSTAKVNGSSGNLVVEEAVSSPNNIIYSLIRSMDNGEGVAIEDIINKSNDSKAEDMITRLLENGDIFEIKPGKVKVLE